VKATNQFKKKYTTMEVEKIMQELERKHPGESEFLQAVKEVLISIKDVYNQHPEFEKAKIVERIVEPERVHMFRVPWVDDNGEVHVNIGYRVQFNSAIGPYKGGLRFHPSVNLSIMKFLGFEQTFKNALTTLPMGGAKGGSDFAPRGRSDAEIMRFCQAFMQELYRYIGPDEDVPAGDIGVGGREIGYLFGEYKKLTHRYEGVLTGKGMEWGGSILRPEATGFGALYFVHHMMENKGLSMKGKTVAISGFGNVAWGAVKKATQLGAKVITISGPDGYIYDPDGISGEKNEYMLELRASGNDVCAPYAEKYPEAKFVADKKPWEEKADIYLTCATQNELNGEDAEKILANKPLCVAEVSNMGCTAEAVDKFVAAKQLFAPGKAVNAGGVATSGLEMTQNSIRLHWSKDEVDDKLHYIMSSIHEQCVKYGTEADGYVNYVKGANIAGFMKVAKAMLAQGIV
jgi:glutamate dehydrogenase (NADP+)